MKKEHTAGLIFLLVGVYGLIYSSQLPLGKWNEPGPGVFPMILAILLALSGVLTMVPRGKGEKVKGKSSWREFLWPLITPLQIVLLTIAYILCLEPIGYLASSLLYLFILFIWVCRYRLPMAMGMAAAFGLGSWYLFVKILGVQLPLTVTALGL